MLVLTRQIWCERDSEFVVIRLAVTIPDGVSDELASARAGLYVELVQRPNVASPQPLKRSRLSPVTQEKNRQCTVVVPEHHHAMERTVFEMVTSFCPRVSEHSLALAKPSVRGRLTFHVGDCHCLNPFF